MNWKLKAAVQRAIALLPDSASYELYYQLQRRFGSLRQVNPIGRLRSGVETWDAIRRTGLEPGGKTFFEVGTGRIPLAPIAFWLMGAGRTFTIDLNPYLKEDLLQESLGFMAANQEAMHQLFGERLQSGRLASLMDLVAAGPIGLHPVLEHCGITYVAPGDAAATSLPSRSIDIHTSYTVFEHIPAPVLAAILCEGRRLVTDDGLLVHRIDYSDHFAHSDSDISLVNFLQFDAKSWDRITGNRYMYMNRLRDDDYLRLFESAGLATVLHEPDLDPRSLELIESGRIRPDRAFAGKTYPTIATVAAWIAARPAAKHNLG